MVFGTVAAFVCAFAAADAGYLHIQCRLLHIILKNIGRKWVGVLAFGHWAWYVYVQKKWM